MPVLYGRTSRPPPPQGGVRSGGTCGREASQAEQARPARKHEGRRGPSPSPRALTGRATRGGACAVRRGPAITDAPPRGTRGGAATTKRASQKATRPKRLRTQAKTAPPHNGRRGGGSPWKGPRLPPGRSTSAARDRWRPPPDRGRRPWHVGIGLEGTVISAERSEAGRPTPIPDTAGTCRNDAGAFCRSRRY
jgi:hypothetical protein